MYVHFADTIVDFHFLKVQDEEGSHWIDCSVFF
jgi:hypothetical protein